MQSIDEVIEVKYTFLSVSNSGIEEVDNEELN